jgi:hypothetical protein
MAQVCSILVTERLDSGQVLFFQSEPNQKEIQQAVAPRLGNVDLYYPGQIRSPWTTFPCGSNITFSPTRHVLLTVHIETLEETFRYYFSVDLPLSTIPAFLSEFCIFCPMNAFTVSLPRTVSVSGDRRIGEVFAHDSSPEVWVSFKSRRFPLVFRYRNRNFEHFFKMWFAPGDRVSVALELFSRVLSGNQSPLPPYFVNIFDQHSLLPEDDLESEVGRRSVPLGVRICSPRICYRQGDDAVKELDTLKFPTYEEAVLFWRSKLFGNAENVKLQFNGVEISPNHNLLYLKTTPENPIQILRLIEFKFVVPGFSGVISKHFSDLATVAEVKVELGNIFAGKCVGLQGVYRFTKRHCNPLDWGLARPFKDEDRMMEINPDSDIRVDLRAVIRVFARDRPPFDVDIAKGSPVAALKEALCRWGYFSPGDCYHDVFTPKGPLSTLRTVAECGRAVYVVRLQNPMRITIEVEGRRTK